MSFKDETKKKKEESNKAPEPVVKENIKKFVSPFCRITIPNKCQCVSFFARRCGWAKRGWVWEPLGSRKE